MKKIFLKLKIRLSLIDMIQILLMESSEFEISLTVENYDEKTAENY